MPKRLQNILEETGFTTREARIYLAVLRKPEASLAEVARLTLIPRMSCYGILRALLQKGFVDVLIKKKRHFFIAVPPERLLYSFTSRQKEFQDAIPRFARYSRTGFASTQVKFFEGQEGIRAVFRSIIDEKRPFVAITSIEDMEYVARVYFEEFIRQRIRQNLKVRLLTNHTPAAVSLKKKDAQELRETRFVKGVCNGRCGEDCVAQCDEDCTGECGCVFHTAEYIFGNVVAILSLKQNPLTALIIEDPEIAKTHMMYFDLLWNQAGVIKG